MHSAESPLKELREELCGIIAEFCKVPLHRDTTIRALSRPGFALHPESSCRAGVFVLEVAETKVAAVHTEAGRRGYPLRAGVEKE